MRLTANGKTEVIGLGKAIRRSILRLGTTEAGGAGLFVENPCMQTHAVMAGIQEQESALVALTCQVIGASRICKINFPASRNPAGVYSDAAGGIKTGEYSIG